jgi:RimJ/RimL family protein N-acetyltransferase
MLQALDIDRTSFSPWLPWVQKDNRNTDECLTAISRMQERRERTEPPADDFVIGIFDRASGSAIGGTGLHRIVHAAAEGEIGYWIRPDRRAQGLCTEAIAGLISWAFTPQPGGGWGLRRIHIRCAARNLASQRVPAKLGLRQEARLIGERWIEGFGYDDTLVWGVLSGEWNRRDHRRL